MDKIFRLSASLLPVFFFRSLTNAYYNTPPHAVYENYVKPGTFFSSRRLLLLLSILLVFVTAGCGGSGGSEQTDSTVNISGPLPDTVLSLLNPDQSNLSVDVIVDGGTAQACNNVLVDTLSGTYNCHITLAEGNHSLVMVFSIIDSTYGSIQVAVTDSKPISILKNQTANADFSATALTYDDDDNDGISNVDELNEGSDPTVTSYYIGGTVTGMVGTGAVLQVNAASNLTLSNDGNFKFTPAVVDGTSYTVTILTQPTSPAQTCAVNNGTGTVAASDISNVQIICYCVLGYSQIGSCTMQ